MGDENLMDVLGACTPRISFLKAFRSRLSHEDVVLE